MLEGLAAKKAATCLAAYQVRTVASERRACHPAAARPNQHNYDQEDAELLYEEDEPQNDAGQAVFHNGDEVQKSALHPRLGYGAQDCPSQGRHGLRQMWKIQHVGYQ